MISELRRTLYVPRDENELFSLNGVTEVRLGASSCIMGTGFYMDKLLSDFEKDFFKGYAYPCARMKYALGDEPIKLSRAPLKKFLERYALSKKSSLLNGAEIDFLEISDLPEPEKDEAFKARFEKGLSGCVISLTERSRTEHITPFVNGVIENGRVTIYNSMGQPISAEIR